jgi:hypothetical protein
VGARPEKIDQTAATNFPSDVRGIGAGFASACIPLSFVSRERNLGFLNLPQAARSEKPSDWAIGAIAVVHLLIRDRCPSTRRPSTSTAALTRLAGFLGHRAIGSEVGLSAEMCRRMAPSPEPRPKNVPCGVQGLNP